MSSHTTANRKIKLTNFILIQNKKLNKNYLHHFVRRENVKNLNVLIAKLVPWFCMLLNLKMVDLFIIPKWLQFVCVILAIILKF